MRMLRPRDRDEEIDKQITDRNKKLAALDTTVAAGESLLDRLPDNPNATFAERMSQITKNEEAKFKAGQFRAEVELLRREKADLLRAKHAEAEAEALISGANRGCALAASQQETRRLFGEYLDEINRASAAGFTKVVAALPTPLPFVISLASSSSPGFNGLTPYIALDAFEFRCRALRASVQS